MAAEDLAPTRTSIARGTAYGLGADVVSVVSALVLSVVVTRFLGPENRGVYFVVILGSSLVAMLLDLGLSTAGLTFATSAQTSISRLHGIAVGAAFVAASLAAVLFVIPHDFWTTHVFKGTDLPTLAILATGVAPLLYVQITGAVFVGMGRIARVSTLRVVGAIAAPLVMLPAVWLSDGSPFWALIAWLGHATALAMAYGVDLLRAGYPPARPQAVEVRDAVGFGIRAHLGTISHFGLLRIDTLFISARLGPTAVGFYSLSSVLAERLAIVGSAVYNASAPRVGGADREAAAELIAKLTRLLVVVLVAAAALLALMAEPLITLLYGDDFRPSVSPFRLLLPGAVCLTLWYVIGLYLIVALRRPIITTAIQGSAILVGIPAYYLAVRSWGLQGAAVTSSLLYVSVFVLGALYFLRSTHITVAGLIPRVGDARELAHLVRRRLARARP